MLLEDWVIFRSILLIRCHIVHWGNCQSYRDDANNKHIKWS